MSGSPAIGLPPTRAVLQDGRRQHFQHGPIDLVIEAFGLADEVAFAYQQAWQRFRSILGELTSELPHLRRAANDPDCRPRGRVARHMQSACRRHQGLFVTPMAAVAGAVADDVLRAMGHGRRLSKAYVNNGGDIALHLESGQSFRTGIVALADRPAAEGIATIEFDSPIRGIATSGWRGRSLSLGIADSVTVLASDAATADVAATLIANAVNVDHPAVARQPAVELDPQSDLGDCLVTTSVGSLPRPMVDAALTRGRGAARRMIEDETIIAAMLTLQGRSCLLDESCKMDPIGLEAVA